MKTALLGKFVCPESQQPLHATVEGACGDDVMEGGLSCDGSTVCPITEGIPRFVPNDDKQTQTARSFAQKWLRHDYYREHTAGFYTDWFLKRYGFDGLDDLGSLLKSARYVLDAGTGSGRDAANFARISDAIVFAADLVGPALENARHTIHLPNVAFVQCDISRLPFADDFFDFINCDQVIHHTPDPPVTFAHLTAKLKPGGQICVYVYRQKAVIREFVDDHVRQCLKDLSFDEALDACEGITRLGESLAELNVTIDIQQDIPVLGIKRGKFDLQRFVHWNLFKCFWNAGFDFFTNNVVNADWYHPQNCFRYHPAEFRAWFDDRWDILSWDVQESGISCRARKK